MGFQDSIRKRRRPRGRPNLPKGSPADNGGDSDLLQSIVDAIDVGIGVVDRKGSLLLSNRAWADIVGIGATGVKPKEWPKRYGLFRPDGETPFPAKDLPLSDAIRGGASDDVEMFIRNPRRPEGAHLIATARPLTNDDGEVKGAVAVFRDVTESRETGGFLKRQTAILESTTDFVGFATPDGTLQFVNYAGLKMCGLDEGTDVRELKLLDMQPEWVHRLMIEQAFPLVNRIGIWNGEAAFLHRDGHEIPVSMVLLAHTSEDGQVECYSTISRDITELKRLETELRASEAKCRNLVEAAPVAILEVDLSGMRSALEDLRAQGITGIREYLKSSPEFLHEPTRMVEILGANAAALKLGGAESGDEFLAGLGEIFTSETANALEEIAVALWEGRTHCEGESLISTLSGVRAPVLMSLTIPGSPPHYTGAIMTLTDITDRKKAEEELARQAQDLARSNADLEQFAYVASHDLKEPLRMISSFLGLLEEHCKGRLDADADEFIAFAKDGAERMQKQITDLLEYSRVSSLPHHLEAVNCGPVLKQAMANLQDAIKESGAVVTHDTLPTVVADRSQMVRLFQNLVGNAIKFRGTDPPKVHISTERRGKEWRFAVRDNGLGIDPAHAERIFTLFQRLHPREAYPGTGMGLAICKKIVERLGGRIWVRSEPGKGSTFYFTLPEWKE